MCFYVFSYCYRDHRDLHVLTHSFPTRRSSDLDRPFGAGILFFPISYVIGDVLTEVYGYARARRVIWAGFVAVLFMALMSWVVVKLPAAESWGNQRAYEIIFGQVPRIVFASVLALDRKSTRLNSSN